MTSAMQAQTRAMMTRGQKALGSKSFWSVTPQLGQLQLQLD